MYSNQQPPIYTTRHYIHEPSSNSRSNSGTSYSPPRPAQPYPYYANSQPPTTVTYVNDRPNYGQPPPSYGSSSANNYASSNPAGYAPVIRSNSNYARSSSGGGGGIDKTNMLSNENPFVDPARPYENLNLGRTVTSITAQPKSGGSLNKSLNLSEENPFHAVYGGYRYSSQIDPSKRITTQAVAVRSTENKSLNLSDENPFFSTYGRYHYPSQIDPQKRITEMPKSVGQFLTTNEMSENNPFNSHRPTLIRDYSGGAGGGGGGGGPTSFSTSIGEWSRNNPAPLSYRPIQVQQPPAPAPTFRYSHDEPPTFFSNTPSSMRPATPPRQQQPPPPPRVQQQPPPPSRVQPQQPPSPQKTIPSAPQDKTSLNMSPDNPFASTYGQYRYPSTEEIKAQKRSGERNVRFTEQQQPPPAAASINRPQQPPSQPANQMTEYPETEQKKEVIQGKGKTQFARFDVTF